MPQLVTSPDFIEWARVRLPFEVKDFGPCFPLGVVIDNKPVACAIYNNYYGYDVQLSFVSTTPRWASREIIKSVLGYPFEVLGCLRISTLTDETNEKALKLNEKLGFVCEGVLRKGSPAGNGNNGVIHGLTKEDWYRSKYCG